MECGGSTPLLAGAGLTALPLGRRVRPVSNSTVEPPPSLQDSHDGRQPMRSLPGCKPIPRLHLHVMAARLHFTAVRRRAAMCLVLWAVAFFGCSLHCAVAGQVVAKPEKSHACCGKQAGKAATPKSCCGAMPHVTATDAAQAKVDFAPQWVALVAVVLCSDIAANAETVIALPRPDPDIGPPAELSLLRLAGRAPPALA